MSSPGGHKLELEDEVFEAPVHPPERTSGEPLLSENREMTPSASSLVEEGEQTSPSLHYDVSSPESSPHLPRGPSFCRHRSSMSKTKVKELMRKVAQYENDIECLKQKIQETEKWAITLLRRNKYYVYITGECKNVQVGSNNSMVEETPIEPTIDAIAGLEELVQKLTSAVEVNIQERVTIESKLDKSEVHLEELRKSIKVCTDKIKQHDETNNAQMGDLKQMLETLTAQRSEQSVVTDGVTALKTLDKDTLTSEQFPSDVKDLAELMMKRFRILTKSEFSERLGVRPSSSTTGDVTPECVLDQQTCVQILLTFLQSPNNNADKLMTIIRMYEDQKTEEKIDLLRKETVGGTCVLSDFSSTHHQQSETHSDTAGSSTHEESGFKEILEILFQTLNTCAQDINIAKCMSTENNALLKDNAQKKESKMLEDEMFV